MFWIVCGLFVCLCSHVLRFRLGLASVLRSQLYSAVLGSTCDSFYLFISTCIFTSSWSLTMCSFCKVLALFRSSCSSFFFYFLVKTLTCVSVFLCCPGGRIMIMILGVIQFCRTPLKTQQNSTSDCWQVTFKNLCLYISVSNSSIYYTELYQRLNYIQ